MSEWTVRDLVAYLRSKEPGTVVPVQIDGEDHDLLIMDTEKRGDHIFSGEAWPKAADEQ